MYSEPPHVGRGGWTWYTGSSGWLHRAATEWILGVRRRGDALLVDPCIPRAWPRYDVTVRHGRSRYQIVVENPRGVNRGVATADLDGRPLTLEPAEAAWTGDPLAEAPPRRDPSEAPPRRRARVPLSDDGAEHQVRIVLG